MLETASALPCRDTPSPSPANRLRAQNTAAAAQISSDRYVRPTQMPRPMRRGESRRRDGGDDCSGSAVAASGEVGTLAVPPDVTPELALGAAAPIDTSVTG